LFCFITCLNNSIATTRTIKIDQGLGAFEVSNIGGGKKRGVQQKGVVKEDVENNIKNKEIK